VERRWRVSAGRLLALSGDDGVRLSLGNDWGEPARRDRPGALTSATA
jgi:hypothetical protein